MGTRGYTLITGGMGFVGSNLADSLLGAGERVVVLDDFSRAGVEGNAEWLLSRHGSALQVEVGDITDATRVAPLVRGAYRVYHLAAQVAVTTSVRDPSLDLRSNLLGTFNILEAARSMSEPPGILFTSTNKVYGALDGVPVERSGDVYVFADGREGIGESAPLDFRSPYGCSKGAADQYVRDYARIYGIPTVVFRLSCVYGTRQVGTEDQGWVAHFARALMAKRPITVYGDGCQVRDILWIGDLVDVMQRVFTQPDAMRGEVFNIGGASANAVSVMTVIDYLTEITGSRVPVEMSDWRPGDQRIYVSDTAKAERMLGWRPTTSWHDGLETLVEWLAEERLTLPCLSRDASERDARAMRAAS